MPISMQLLNRSEWMTMTIILICAGVVAIAGGALFGLGLTVFFR